MIQSMTGHGAAECVEAGVQCALEIRSVNNRYLKVSIRVPDKWQFVELAIEKAIRKRLSRGSVTCSLRVRAESDDASQPLNMAAMQGYLNQLASVKLPTHLGGTVDLAALACMPGVMQTADPTDEIRTQRLAAITRLADEAITSLIQMRSDEGKALLAALSAFCESIESHLGEIEARAPVVIKEYHERLQTRVTGLMQAGEFELQQDALAREVAVYAERCDISEEVVRLRSHMVQFQDLCDRRDSVGRTLDFLTQELLREANTIGSKSNDAAIACGVIEIKALIDRMKEQALNVE